MAWGNFATSKIPLTYSRLSAELDAKKLKGRGYVDKVRCAGNVVAYYKGEDIAVRLHATEIMTFHPNGDITLCMGGWDTPMTRHWITQGVGGYHLFNATPNKWTRRQTFYDKTTSFYDNMRVDRHGDVLSGARPGVKLTPNAEAKALRKEWLAHLNKIWLPHLRMYEARGATMPPRHLKIDEFDYEIMRWAVNTHAGGNNKQRFMSFMNGHYEAELHRRNLFDREDWLPT